MHILVFVQATAVLVLDCLWTCSGQSMFRMCLRHGLVQSVAEEDGHN